MKENQDVYYCDRCGKIIKKPRQNDDYVRFKEYKEKYNSPNDYVIDRMFHLRNEQYVFIDPDEDCVISVGYTMKKHIQTTYQFCRDCEERFIEWFDGDFMKTKK